MINGWNWWSDQVEWVSRFLKLEYLRWGRLCGVGVGYSWKVSSSWHWVLLATLTGSISPSLSTLVWGKAYMRFLLPVDLSDDVSREVAECVSSWSWGASTQVSFLFLTLFIYRMSLRESRLKDFSVSFWRRWWSGWRMCFMWSALPWGNHQTPTCRPGRSDCWAWPPSNIPQPLLSKITPSSRLSSTGYHAALSPPSPSLPLSKNHTPNRGKM